MLPLVQDLKPRIHITMSDFNSITQSGRLCDSKGQLSAMQFEVAMREQMKYYTHRQLCDCIAHGEASESEIAQVCESPSLDPSLDLTS